MSTKLTGLFLDDERFPEQVKWVEYPDNIDWIRCCTPYDFTEMICLDYFNIGEELGIRWHTKYQFDYYTFDHDLQFFVDGQEITGYDCLKALCEAIQRGIVKMPKKVFFHSMNPCGRENMEAYWISFLKYGMH